MKTFYINLDSAKQRKNKFLDKDFERWRATPRSEVPPEIDQNMISMWNFGREAHLARCGCFISHINLLKHIIDNKLNDVLILEDDAVQVNEIPTDYPRDGIVYLGGFLYHRKMMQDKDPKIDSVNGINLVDKDYRILGCLSYIIPTWEVADKIIKSINKLNRIRAVDITFGNIDMKQYYNFPGSFREEGCESQISQKNKNNKIMTEDYKFISMKKYRLHATLLF